jgi:HSP20 family protein
MRSTASQSDRRHPPAGCRKLVRFCGGHGFAVPGTLGNAGLMPSIDVNETDKEIEITAELPGLERKDVEISLADNILAIRGEKKLEQEQKDEKSKNQHSG